MDLSQKHIVDNVYRLFFTLWKYSGDEDDPGDDGENERVRFNGSMEME